MPDQQIQEIPVLLGAPAPRTVLAALVERGAVLLHGGWDHEAFVALGDTLMEPMPYQGGFHNERKVVEGDPTTTTVTHGTQAMPLHREASYAPGSPDVLMFRCERPAADGGATTLCDGVALLAALPDLVRTAFERLELRWESSFPTAQWQRMCGTHDPASAIRLLRRWERHLRSWESIHVDIDDAMMTVGFGTKCTPPTRFGAIASFCNSLFMSRPRDGEYRDQRLRVRTATGEPVPTTDIDAAFEAAQELDFRRALAGR